jgi:hypothetical protein
MMIPKFLSDRIAESIYAELHYQAWARKILKSKIEQKQINAESIKSVLFIKQNRK